MEEIVIAEVQPADTETKDITYEIVGVVVVIAAVVAIIIVKRR